MVLDLGSFKYGRERVSSVPQEWVLHMSYDGMVRASSPAELWNIVLLRYLGICCSTLFFVRVLFWCHATIPEIQKASTPADQIRLDQVEVDFNVLGAPKPMKVLLHLYRNYYHNYIILIYVWQVIWEEGTLKHQGAVIRSRDRDDNKYTIMPWE